MTSPSVPTFRLLLCLWLLALPAIAAMPPLPDAACTPFTWASAGPGHEKAAMLVDTTVAGRHYTLQLDTGSDVTGLYGPGSSPESPTALRAGAIKFAPVDIKHFQHLSPGRAHGVIGLDSLAGKRLVIDHPGQRLCDLSAQDTGFTSRDWIFLPARLRSGKLFLHTREPARDSWHYFWDTGASSYHLVTDKAHWQRLTGRRGDEADNRILGGSGWGKRLTTVAAPSTGSVMIGSLRLDEAEISYVREQPERFARYPFRVHGLIGNAPFFDLVVLLDLTGSDARFAILRQPDILNTPPPATAERLQTNTKETQ